MKGHIDKVRAFTVALTDSLQLYNFQHSVTGKLYNFQHSVTGIHR